MSYKNTRCRRGKEKYSSRFLYRLGPTGFYRDQVNFCRRNPCLMTQLLVRRPKLSTRFVDIFILGHHTLVMVICILVCVFAF